MAKKTTKPKSIMEPAAKEPAQKLAFKFKPKNEAQRFAWREISENDYTFLTGLAGGGKTFVPMVYAIERLLAGEFDKIILSRPAVESCENIGFLPGPQPLDARVLTPTGWTTMGSIKVGDEVIGRDGKPTKVLGVFPKGVKKVYRVHTTDGTSTECCEDHLWLTSLPNDRKHHKPMKVRTTREIMDTLRSEKNKINHHLPRNEPVHYSQDGDLPIPPYVLGVLLGDGYMGDHICFASADQEIVDRMSKECQQIGFSVNKTTSSGGIGYGISQQSKQRKVSKPIAVKILSTGEEYGFVSHSKLAAIVKSPAMTVRSRARTNASVGGLQYRYLPRERVWQHEIKENLRLLGLLGKKAWDKFIPDQYKFSSIENRISLLRGLMDTDGSAKASTGEASYTTTSIRLAKDVVELVRSLGGKASIRSRNRTGKTSVLADGHTITGRREIYEFNISLPPTINPFHLSRKANRVESRQHKSKRQFMHGVGIEQITPSGEKECQCILVENPEHLYVTDDFIVTHNTMKEKISPFLTPVFDAIDKIMKDCDQLKERIKASIEIVPLAYARGRTFEKCFCILDEAQNADPDAIEMYMTRLGEGSKMVLCGDDGQPDISRCVLRDVAFAFFSEQQAGWTEFTESVRHPRIVSVIRIMSKFKEKRR